MRISDWSSDVCSSDLFVASWLRANPINVKGKVITKSPRYLVAAFALIIAVILLGLAVGAGWTETADWQISRALSLRLGERSPAFLAFMHWASWPGPGIEYDRADRSEKRREGKEWGRQ